MTIEELRRMRAGVHDQVQILAKKEADGETLTAEELTQFSSLQAEFENLTAQIQRAEAAERMAASVAEPVRPATGTPAVVIKEELQQYKGAGMTRMVMSIAAGQGNLSDAAHFAATELGDKNLSMAISTASNSGGALIPQNMQNEVIELLRDRTIVRKLGARSIPLPNGNLSMPRMAGGATAGYVGEGQDVIATGGKFDDVKLSAKTMIALVPISNQLIGRSGFNTEQMILGDIISAISNREDKAFLRDDGTGNTPTGMKAAATAANRLVPWTGTDLSLTAVDRYLDSLILKHMDSNSNMTKCGWGLSNRSYMFLFGLRDGNRNKVYPEMSLGRGTLKGYPIERTSAIPANLGTGGNESEIYFCDFNDVVIGEEGLMKVSFSTEATYKDADGNLVSAFARNQSLIRVVTEHDIGFRHPEGLVLGTKVTW